MKSVVAIVLLALGVAACASAPASTGRDREVLTRAEIVEAGHMNALEVIRSERPQWLYRRGARTMSDDTDVAVYLDGVRIGGPEALAQIPAINIAEMRHYSEREAQFKWGVGHLHGAIEVISMKG